jgi:PAS domain S-box-containing protein
VRADLARTNADVVLLDLGLPDSQGLDTLRSIRKQAPRLPIVVLTGLRDEEMGVDASREGAQDYLTKNTLTPELLTTTLRYAIARQRVQDELRGERDFREAMLQTAQVTVLVLDSAGRIMRFNRHFEELSGVSLDEARGRDWFETFLPTEEQARIRTLFTGALAGQQTRGNVSPIVTRNGEYRWLEWYDKTLTDDSGDVTLVCIGVDVTEKRRMVRQQALVAEVLAILNRPNEWKALIIDILEAIQTSTGMEAVAIRLEQEGDFPYAAVRGFPPEFAAIESRLVDCDAAGLPKRDAQGGKALACMCGNVICGRTDAALPFFTEGGSFWTNSTTQLLASTTEKERQSATRNQCNAFGYESVALIPVRANGNTIGLLQLNDRRPDRFNAGIIQFLEELSASVGVAFKRQQTEERYRMLFERNMAGVYITAMDGRFTACNRAFSDMLGFASPDEVLSLHAAELYFNAADREEFLGGLHAAREIVGKEYRLRRKDGQPIWVVESASLIQTGSGGETTLQGTVVDVTRLHNTQQALQDSLEGTLRAVSRASETRDPYTAGHQHRVTDLALAIAHELGLSDDECEALRAAGLTHDIGKLGIPAEILSKPGKLAPIELALIREHPQAAYSILADAPFPGPVAEIVLQHHERLDGSGYPRALAGDQILREARILAVADVVEAMASHRPYRPALGIDAALREIEQNAGLLYDSEAVEACLHLFRDKGYTLPA